MKTRILRALWNLFNPMASPCKIVKGDSLLDCHTIVRHVKGGHVLDDGSIAGDAFLSNTKDAGEVSYNWLDFFDGDIKQQLTELRLVINRKPSNTAVLAELNVGDVRHKLMNNIPDMEVIYDPTEKSDSLKQDYSHCFMTDIPDELSSEADCVGELISELVSSDKMYPRNQP